MAEPYPAVDVAGLDRALREERESDVMANRREDPRRATSEPDAAGAAEPDAGVTHSAVPDGVTHFLVPDPAPANTVQVAGQRREAPRCRPCEQAL